MKKLLLIISIFFIGLNTVYGKETVKFSRCVDGDTIKVFINDEEVTVRLLAIDTPESVKPDTSPAYYGKEASEYTCNRVTNAQKIELEYDEKSDKQDKYDRYLAWVFVDNKLLQEELVSKGYAKVAYLYDDYKYISLLNEKQELASAKNIGVWNEQAKKKYEASLETNTTSSEEEYMNLEIGLLVIIFLIITFITKLFVKKK